MSPHHSPDQPPERPGSSHQVARLPALDLSLSPGHHRFFSFFPPQRSEALLAASTKRELAAGDMLFRAGDSSDGLYLVLSGTIEVSNPVGPDRSIVLKLVSAGDYFAEFGVFDGQPRFSDAAALTDATLLHVPAELCSEFVWGGLSEAGEHPFILDVLKRIRATLGRYVEQSVQREAAAELGQKAQKFFERINKTFLNIEYETNALAQNKELPEAVEGHANKIIEAVDKATLRTTELLADCREFSAHSLDDDRFAFSASEFVRHDVVDISQDDGLASHELQQVPRQSWIEEEISEEERRLLPEEHSIFTGLSSGHADLLLQSAYKFQLREGEYAFEQGDPGDSFYLLLDGSLRFSRRAQDGREAKVGSVSGDDFFGELSALDGRSRTMSVRATSDATLIHIPRENVTRLIADDPFGAGRVIVSYILGKARASSAAHMKEILQSESLAMIARSSREIVHDLRSPLAVMGTAAQMVCDWPDDAERNKDMATKILQQLGRMRIMAADWSETSDGQPTIASAPFNLSRLLSRFEKLYAGFMARKKVELSVTKVPRVIMGDEEKLLRVLQNLVTNSVEAMTGERGKVSIVSDVVEKQGKEYVRITVEDNGKGMSESVRSRIFEVYATYGKSSGTGLGLPIAKSIVVAHGGTISCKTEEGRGSTFTVTLPV